MSRMPSFMELQKRIKHQDRLNISLGSEEILETDCRGRMRPGEFVEQKLEAAQASRMPGRGRDGRPTDDKIGS